RRASAKQTLSTRCSRALSVACEPATTPRRRSTHSRLTCLAPSRSSSSGKTCMRTWARSACMSWNVLLTKTGRACHIAAMPRSGDRELLEHVEAAGDVKDVLPELGGLRDLRQDGLAAFQNHVSDGAGFVEERIGVHGV